MRTAIFGAVGPIALCAITLLSCQQAAVKRGVTISDIENRVPDAAAVASTIQKSVMSITEFEPGLMTILLNEKTMEQTLGAVTYRKGEGAFAFEYKGHSYDLYLSALGECVEVTPPDNYVYMINVRRGQEHTKVAKEFPIIDAGQYTLWIIEDHRISWGLDLKPAFQNLEVPHHGGVEPTEADLRMWWRQVAKKCI